MPSTDKRGAFSLVELIVSMAIIGLLVALLLPAVQSVRQAAQKTRCANNLRQIGLALHHDHDLRGAFPPGCSYNGGRDSMPHVSWCTRILPLLERDDLWRDAVAAFAQARFFETVPPHGGLGIVLDGYVCPADDAAHVPWDFRAFQVAYTDYLGVEGTDQTRRDGVLFLDSRVKLADIADGTANTLLAGERPPSGKMYFGWRYAGWGQAKDGSAEAHLGARERATHESLVRCPADANRFRAGRFEEQCDNLHFWSYHPGGGHFLLCDGSVRFLRYEADAVLPALVTRAGGEVAAWPE